MSDIEFEADIQGNPRYSHNGSTPGGMQAPQFTQQGHSNVGMIRWLVRHGILHDESIGKVILVAFIVFNFVATALIMYFYVLR